MITEAAEASDKVSYSNTKQLTQSAKQKCLSIIERAKSEGRFLNMNLPSQNLIPLLGIVSEAPQTKKINVKQTTKRLQKQSQIQESQQSKSMIRTKDDNQSVHSSPMRQYGVVSNCHQMRSEHNSLNSSLLQKSDGKQFLGKKLNDQKTNQNVRSSKEQNMSIKNRYASNIHLETGSLKRGTNLSTTEKKEETNEIRLQLPIYSQREDHKRVSPINRSFQLNPRIDIRPIANTSIDKQYLSLVQSNDGSSERSSSQQRYRAEYSFLRDYKNKLQSNDRSIAEEQKNPDDPQQFNSLQEGSFIDNQNSLIARPKMKPVKVIPSSRRKNQQGLPNIAKNKRVVQPSPMPGQIYYPNTQQQTLKQSNSQASLVPLQNINSSIRAIEESNFTSQHTTMSQNNKISILARGDKDHNSSLLRISEDEAYKHSLSSLSKQLISQQFQQPKPAIIPIRQQLYMDERNPFLDSTRDKLRLQPQLSNPAIILNQSELIPEQQHSLNRSKLDTSMQNLSPKNLYQLPNPHVRVIHHPLLDLNQSAVLPSVKRQNRNNSSLDYGNPQSVKSSSGLPPPHRSSSRYAQESQQSIQLQPLKLLPHQVNSVNNQQIFLHPNLVNHQQQLESSNQTSFQIPQELTDIVSGTETSKRKSRINLLEKARKILVEQNRDRSSQVSQDSRQRKQRLDNQTKNESTKM